MVLLPLLHIQRFANQSLDDIQLGDKRRFNIWNIPNILEQQPFRNYILESTIEIDESREGGRTIHISIPDAERSHSLGSYYR